MKDLFSGHAKQYAAFRPHYPKALYDVVLQHVAQREAAWDCATGNGQVATALAASFRHVYATDISAQQLHEAPLLPNVHYSVVRAEQATFPTNAFDLITVAQAIHWIDCPSFYNVVRQVARPGALLALWGYNLLQIDPDVDRIVTYLYRETVGPYWDAARRLVDESYQTIEFPFREIPAPPLAMEFEWTREQLAGYLSTWSAVQGYIRATGTDPIPACMEAMARVWPNGATRVVRFPIFMRMGYVM